MKNIRQWLNEYQESHLNPTNKLIHWICIPPIVLAVLGFLRAIPVGTDALNAATVTGAAALVYYAVLSWRLAIGVAVVFVMLYSVVQWSYDALGVTAHLWTMAAVFVAAWVGQFIGHNIEGKRPSFFKDLQFLLIGPLWLLADVYRRLDLAIDARAGASAQG